MPNTLDGACASSPAAAKMASSCGESVCGFRRTMLSKWCRYSSSSSLAKYSSMPFLRHLQNFRLDERHGRAELDGQPLGPIENRLIRRVGAVFVAAGERVHDTAARTFRSVSCSKSRHAASVAGESASLPLYSPMRGRAPCTFGEVFFPRFVGRDKCPPDANGTAPGISLRLRTVCGAAAWLINVVTPLTKFDDITIMVL